MTDPMMPDIDRARALLNGIGWDDVSINSVPGGSINNTFKLTDGSSNWYLRIGPTDVDVEAGPSWFTGKGLQREQRAISLWFEHTHLFPKTVHTDFSRSQIAADWVIQEEIPGDPWEAIRARLSQNQARSLWQSFGSIVSGLHAYTSPEFGPPDPGIGYSSWSELCRWDATGLLTDAHKFGLPTDPFTRLCELVDRYTFELDEVEIPRLIHSDLGLRHVMVDFDEDNEPFITGLIDMEFARFADPYSESIFVAQALQPQQDPMFDFFLEAYGAERQDRDFRIRSLIYQLVAMAWWVTDAMRRHRPTEAQEILDKLVQRLDEDKRM